MDGAANGVGLALQALGIDAGARPHPVLSAAAIKAVADRGGDRRIADAHFADA
jgi:hypothetical protein